MGPAEFVTAVPKGKLGPAYLFRGPDRFLHEECRAALVASIPAEAHAWCLADVEFQPGRLKEELQSAQQMPMLGGHIVFLFSDPDDFKHADEGDYESLQAYLERPSPFATLVFIAVEPDRRRRFLQLLERHAEVVEMQPLGAREAAAWAREFLLRAGVAITRELSEELAARFESSKDPREETAGAGVNLLWLRTELEKLLTARPAAKRLERDDLELVVGFREEHVIGKLLRAMAERQCGQALEHLRALLASKEPETLLLWSVGDLFRQALKGSASTAYKRGGWNRSPGPYWISEIAAVASRNYRRDELLNCLRLVRQADLGIKSSWKDSKILLEYLVWQMTAGRGRGSASSLVAELPPQAVET